MASGQVVIHKGRTMTLQVELPFDVSTDTITSQIRTGKSQDAPLIAEWDVAFETDGVDGKIVLTMDDAVTGGIAQSSGFMDLKRISGGEPLHVFDEPIEVLILGTVTE